MTKLEIRISKECGGSKSERTLSVARPGKSGRAQRAFSLLELLTVIVIIGIIAAVALPSISKFKPNIMAAATRQLQGDIARARQLAISQRTTVYMVFVPTNFWAYTDFQALPQSEKDKGTNLFDKQVVGYNFVSLRSVGDQPGRPTVRYWDRWRTLPEGIFIPLDKFGQRSTALPLMAMYTNVPNASPPTTNLAFQVLGFNVTNSIPFPSEFAKLYKTTFTPLPYIAFDYLGRLVDADGNLAGINEFIPLAQGNVSFSRNPDKTARQAVPTLTESPVGNSTNMFALINIDWLTGRARVEQNQVQ